MVKILTTINVDTDKITKAVEANVGDYVKFVRENAPDAPRKASWGISWSGGKSEADVPYECNGPNADGTIDLHVIKSGMDITLWCDYEDVRTTYDLIVKS